MKSYGEIVLTDSSPPQSFIEPLTVQNVKDFLRIDSTAEDGMIPLFITAARVAAEGEQHRDLIPKQYDLYLDLLLGYDSVAGAAYPLRFNSIYNFGVGYEIYLRYPLLSVDLFQYTDATGITTTMTEFHATDTGPAPNNSYMVSKPRALVVPPYGQIWPFFTPQPTTSVLCRFTSGYRSTHPYWQNDGQMVLMGMKLLIAGWFESRIPFDPTLRGNVSEYPWTITQLLGYGARPRVH